MASIIERVKHLNLPLEEFVVIGSGLLDAWGLRRSRDIDVVVSRELYDILSMDPKYSHEIKYDSEMLCADDIEIWQDWKTDAPFAILKESAVIIDGIQFSNPEIIIKRKQEKASEKNLNDIKLLQEYLANVSQ